jgi:hypothetical protein
VNRLRRHLLLFAVRIHRKSYHYPPQLYLKVQGYFLEVDLPAVVMNKNKEIKETLEVQTVDVPRVTKGVLE